MKLKSFFQTILIFLVLVPNQLIANSTTEGENARRIYNALNVKEDNGIKSVGGLVCNFKSSNCTLEKDHNGEDIYNAMEVKELVSSSGEEGDGSIYSKRVATLLCSVQYTASGGGYDSSFWCGLIN
jgi:hypothetical protein